MNIQDLPQMQCIFKYFPGVSNCPTGSLLQHTWCKLNNYLLVNVYLNQVCWSRQTSKTSIRCQWPININLQHPAFNLDRLIYALLLKFQAGQMAVKGVGCVEFCYFNLFYGPIFGVLHSKCLQAAVACLKSAVSQQTSSPWNADNVIISTWGSGSSYL